MTKKETIERAALLAAVLAEASEAHSRTAPSHERRSLTPVAISRDVAALVAIADRLTNRAVRVCNYGLESDAAETRHNAANDRDYEKAAAIASHYGATVQRMSDVRGFAVKLMLPTGRSNSMGGPSAGWGV